MTARQMTENARIAGIKVGRAIYRDHAADDMLFARGEFELSPEDGDQLTSAGLVPGSAEYRMAEDAAEAEYFRLMGQ